MNNRNKQVSNFTFRITILLVILNFSIHTKIQGQAQLSFEQAVTRVLNENPNLGAAEANLEAMRYNIAIARANYLPGLNVIGSASQSKSATFSQSAGVIPASSAIVGASLSQMIYNEQKVAHAKIQKYLYASQEELYRDTRNTIISTAGISYIGLLFAKDMLAVQEENKRITEQNLKASKDRQEVGSTNMQEVLRWETQLYSDQQAIESQKAAVIIKRGSLNQLLNVPIETKASIDKLSIEENGFIFSSLIVANAATIEEKALTIRDYLVELGISNSPILASIDQQLLAQGRQLDANQRWAIPNFNLSASTNAKFDLDKEESEDVGDDLGFWKVGVTMYWPLVAGGANVSKVKQSKFQMSALEQQRYDFITSLEQSIRASAAVVISDFINVGLANAQANAAQRNYDLVNNAYYLGESSLLDLLDAQNQKLAANIASRVALYTFLNDLLTLEQTIGYFPFLEPEENAQLIINELEGRLMEETY